MKTAFAFVAVLSFASVGCPKKVNEGKYCAKAISNSMALSKAVMEKTPGMDAKMMQRMEDLGVQHCIDDKWSADATKCMTDAKTMTEAQGCYGKLTQDQQDKMNKAAMEMGASAGSASGSAGSAAGSDSAAGGSGSAAAGSAETGTGSAGSAAPPK